jgi:hypothetical protein
VAGFRRDCGALHARHGRPGSDARIGGHSQARPLLRLEHVVRLGR